MGENTTKKYEVIESFEMDEKMTEVGSIVELYDDQASAFGEMVKLVEENPAPVDNGDSSNAPAGSENPGVQAPTPVAEVPPAPSTVEPKPETPAVDKAEDKPGFVGGHTMSDNG